jgi:hypothetical protein
MGRVAVRELVLERVPRFRLEYQHKAGDVPTEDTLYFQATWVFGAHPPHPYWAMK